MKPQKTPVIVTTTAPDRAEAERLARALVERRLGACAQLVDPIRSVYWWDGAIREEAEVLLVVKTTADRVEGIGALLKEMHPYQVPELVAVPVSDGSPAYLGWIFDSLDRP
jgi:periplasmic divalent cation tolerance protein